MHIIKELTCPNISKFVTGLDSCKMNLEEGQDQPSSKRTRHCGHCDRDLSSESYRVHYNRFYDRHNHIWRQENAAPTEAFPPFVPTFLRQTAFTTNTPSSTTTQSEHWTSIPNEISDETLEVQIETSDSIGDSEHESSNDDEQDDIPELFSDSEVRRPVCSGSSLLLETQ